MGSRRGRPPGRTEQGEQTRQRLFEVATELFAEHGYEATTMRAIADAAEVSPGLLYKYFPSKAAVVVALYARLSDDFAVRCEALPSGGWFPRFHQTLRWSLDALDGHRDELRAVMAVMLADPELGLFSEAGAAGRQRVQACFVRAVTDAVDAPSRELAEPLGRLLDLVQLGVILWWLLDRSEDTAATAGLVRWLGSMGSLAGPALWLPGASSTVRRLDQLASAALYGEPLPEAEVRPG